MSVKHLPVHHYLLAGGSGAGILFAIVELFHGDAKEWSGLLEHWGPWFLLAIIAVFLAYDLSKSILLAFLKEFAALVRGVNNAANGLQRVADAQKEQADKDDRQAEETRRLAQHGAQVSEDTLQAVRDLGGKLNEVLQRV